MSLIDVSIRHIQPALAVGFFIRDLPLVPDGPACCHALYRGHLDQKGSKKKAKNRQSHETRQGGARGVPAHLSPFSSVRVCVCMCSGPRPFPMCLVKFDICRPTGCLCILPSVQAGVPVALVLCGDALSLPS
jgi:hypothetical protein